MSKDSLSPAEIRAVFGANLEKLSQGYPSISELSRQLGINRTQYNRYLSGESFPRPDVLARICRFFDVDARILLEPVGSAGSEQDPIANPFLHDYVGAGVANVPEEVFPSGFYRFSRRSFLKMDVFILGIVHVRRSDKNTFIRGFETRAAMKVQNLPTSSLAREFRGIVMQQEDGIVMIASRRNTMTSTFNYLSRVASFENNFWQGYVTRTVPENVGGLRATRMVFELLGNRPRDVLAAARATGFHSVDDLPAFHRRLLMPDVPFS
ncbi:helix-turn-helix domain-containing protein [Marimonas sp. MJW-29]|uniref:Helix-turn-helix domain-containing protein n=1 Tax=Sulfitobacter sediminis TaxID=3234186 RepID=A0ABV3RIW0_9RHOB